ncbi:MAG: serine hydrolase [Candidatus Liptonbacteria bacterium]|nr:serine hydrolase [Candidatus Liptonbacteria bacterium]
MNSFHKIFFIGVIILSVAAGSHFNGARNANGNQAASIIISAVDAAPATENSQPAGTAQSATPNDSTTSNDIKVNGQSDVSTQSQNDNSKTVLDNGALLKPDLSSQKDVFHLIGSAQPPEIQAKSATVVDLKTGRAYFESNQNLRWPMASLTKLMTAVMVLKNMDLKQPVNPVRSSREALNSATAKKQVFISTTENIGHFASNGIKIGDESGGSYSGNDVLNTMLIVSKDEAAEALANAYGRDDFIAGLNSLAAEFGMSSTNFSDPAGLSVANQSTVADLQKLVLNIYQNYPKIFDITRKKSVTVTELNSKKKTKLSNINTFAGTSGFIGGVTGYSDDANSNSLSVFSYANRPILVIVLGTDDSSGETTKLKDWFESNYK